MFGADGRACRGGPVRGFWRGAGLGDIFDAFFGGSPFVTRGGNRRSGPPQGENVEALLDLDFAEAVLGAEREVTVRAGLACQACAGSGARAGTTACDLLDVQRHRRAAQGPPVTARPDGHLEPVPALRGTGEEIPSPCPDCRGQGRRLEERSYNVEVPAGVDDGSTLRLSGRGAAGPRGGPPGDLYLHLRVRPHPSITRDGYDLRTTAQASMAQAALGAQVNVDTLEGPEEVVVPAGCQSGYEVRLRGRGVPHLQRRGRGDLIVTASSRPRRSSQRPRRSSCGGLPPSVART